MQEIDLLLYHTNLDIKVYKLKSTRNNGIATLIKTNRKSKEIKKQISFQIVFLRYSGT